MNNNDSDFFCGKIDYKFEDNDLILIDKFFKYIRDIGENFILDVNKQDMYFIEKLVFDIVNYHCIRKELDLNDYCISFWTKSTPYNYEYIHMHIDHCDYELRKLGSMNIRPVFTCITYFDANECPTVITDVNLDMVNNQTFDNNLNNKLIFSFPNEFKTISFNSGNIFHGEGYLSEYDSSKSRRALVIAVWNKEAKPLHVPTFDHKLFEYYKFIKDNCLIEYKLIDKSKPFFPIKDEAQDIENVCLTTNEIINHKFFIDLLINKTKTTLYPLYNLIKVKTLNSKTILLDISKISLRKLPTLLFVESRKLYQFLPVLNLTEEYNISRELRKVWSPIISTFDKLSRTSLFYNIIHHITTDLHIDISDSYFCIQPNVESRFRRLHDENNISPYISFLFSIKTQNMPTVLTDITTNKYKFKDFSDVTKLYLYYMKAWSSIVIDSNKYCYIPSDTLLITIWKQKPFFKNRDNCLETNLVENIPLQVQSKNEGNVSVRTIDKKLDLLNKLLYEHNIESINSENNSFTKIVFENKRLNEKIHIDTKVLKQLKFDPNDFK
jgi:hypothetical protein